MNSIHLFKPVVSEAAIQAVAEVLRSGWTGLGPKTKQFETDFAKFVNAKYCVALNSCTSALHLALELLDLKEGDEVITTPLTFVSTNHAILYVGATPVFADVQLETGCLDPKSIESKITEKTKAIMVVHFGGYPADMDEIHTIARTYGIQVIEDAAHSCGSMYRSQMIGSVSAINCFSFQAVKNLSLGDGGAITTNNKFYFDKLNKLRWLGIDKSTYARTETSGSTLNAKAYSWLYDVPLVGHKMHMNDINAAIGIEQLKLLDQENARRAEIVEMYREGLKDVAGIKFMQRQADRKSSNHIFAIRADKRDYLMDALKQNDIHCGVHYRLSTRYPMYQKVSLPNAELLERELISLPLHLGLTDEDINRVIEVVKKGW